MRFREDPEKGAEACVVSLRALGQQPASRGGDPRRYALPLVLVDSLAPSADDAKYAAELEVATLVRIKVPASIANIGPGFDCMAMAIDLWLEVQADEAQHPGWDYEGEGADYLAAHENPFTRLKMKGRVRSEIPLGVGLGSSAAARLAASALSSPWDVKSHVIDAGADEGHLDNVAASASGGIRIVSEHIDEKLPNPGWGLALFVAHQPLSTEKARFVLPDAIPLETATFNAARTALLVRAIVSKRPSLLGEALRDRLHQPHRLHLYPWTAEVIRVAEASGAYAAAICGAGPSVFAFCAPSQAARIANAMETSFPDRGRGLVTQITDKGMFRTL